MKHIMFWVAQKLRSSWRPKGKHKKDVGFASRGDPRNSGFLKQVSFNKKPNKNASKKVQARPFSARESPSRHVLLNPPEGTRGNGVKRTCGLSCFRNRTATHKWRCRRSF